MKKIHLISTFALLSVALIGCNNTKPSIKNYEIIHEEEFGGVYVKITIDDFISKGFNLGDGLDVNFDNGTSYSNIPFYNGYYTKAGDPLVIAYPGYPYVKVAINNGDDIYETFNLNIDSKVSITLNSSKAYLATQEARDIHYYDDRDLYDSDVMFANFRAINTGDLKENLFYRSASPCDNQHNRAPYVDRLIEENDITCILDLADSNEKIEEYIAKEDFDSPYFLSLFENNKVYPFALNMSFDSDYFKERINLIIEEIIDNDGPYLVHCTEGKDRTGFICCLIECLANSTYEQIKNDYMYTYWNYYWIDETHEISKYNIILNDVFKPLLSTILQEDIRDYESINYQEKAIEYLLELGLNKGVIDSVIKKISKY